ncbi:MAG TPA: polymer-forming cytoskeletal protein [Pyrinomonadaceae bacterium]|nr:polymer-forming cytoskeletal protein [Pyrinomonadaceae bacterium]
MIVSESTFAMDCPNSSGVDLYSYRSLYRVGAIVTMLLLTVVASRAQGPLDSNSDAKKTQVIEGVIDGNAYGVGRSVRINGTVKEGAIAFGGDVIVQGTVVGDVAAIGGSVIQLEGARIGGDVIVVGGTFKNAANQIPNHTLVYTGYERELQDMMRNPTGLLSPAWSTTYIGLRLLSILFWFVVALVMTSLLPTPVSRGVARLQLTSMRVAAIGFLGAIVVGLGVEACLFLLPTPLSSIVGLITILLIVISGIFGRVVIYAATGRWLQRRFLRMGQNSESVALLLGSLVWGILFSLPYIWPFLVALTVVLSLGLTLTAGGQRAWKKVPAV